MNDTCRVCQAIYDYDYVYDHDGNLCKVQICECGETPIQVVTPRYVSRAVDRYAIKYNTCPECKAQNPVINFTWAHSNNTGTAFHAVFSCCNASKTLFAIRRSKGE